MKLYVILAPVMLAILLMPVSSAETFTRSRMLLPTADDSPLTWTAVGCASQYQCVDENPPHDAEATYLSANPAPFGVLTSSFQLQNLPNDILTVVSVTVFAWARRETLVSNGFYAGFTLESGTACTFAEVPTTTYSNITLTYLLDCVNQSWTDEIVNGMRLNLICTDDGAPPDEDTCRVTTAGVVVTYTVIEGSMTENEWAARFAFTVFALFLIVGVFGKKPIFVLLAGITAVFLSFPVLAITNDVWAIVMFLVLGPMLMAIGALQVATEGHI